MSSLRLRLAPLLDALYMGLLLPAPIYCFWQILYVLITNQFLATAARMPTVFLDFRKYYSMGHILYSNLADHVYDPATQLQFFNSYGTAVPSQTSYYSEYPPYFLLLLAPYALLPVDLAYVVWCLSSVALASAGLWLLGKTCGLSSKQVLVLLAGLLVSVPTWQSLMLGQSSFFLLAIIAIYCWSWLKGRDTICGIAMALSTIKLQYIFFLCMPVVAQKRWRVLAAAFVCEVLLLVSSALPIGWKNVVGYPFVILRADRDNAHDTQFHEILVSLREPLTLLLPYSVAFLVSMIVVGFSCFALFKFWRQEPASSHPSPAAGGLPPQNLDSQPLLLACTVTFAVALSPHTHLHDCVLLAVPAALTLQALSPVRALSIQPVGKRVWHLALLLYPLFGWVVWALFSRVPLLKFSSFTLFNVFLLIVAVRIAIAHRPDMAQ